MDKNYIKFINRHVISEEEFLKLFNSLPEVIKNASDLEFNYDALEDNIAEFFDKYIIEKYSRFGYVDDIKSINNKEFTLWDIESIEELEAIKKNIGDWEITNEEEILNHIKDILNDKEDRAKERIITLTQNLNLEQLTNTINYIKSL